jgi:hypothetical protein
VMTHPGIVGVNARRLRETTYDLPASAVVVLHSDGVTDRMSLDGQPGLLRCSPVVIAAAVIRDFGVRNDDAGVVVLGPEPLP